MKNCDKYSRFTKRGSFSKLEKLRINYFVNQEKLVTTEDKNNTVYEIGWSNCKIIYFGECSQQGKQVNP